MVATDIKTYFTLDNLFKFDSFSSCEMLACTLHDTFYALEHSLSKALGMSPAWLGLFLQHIYLGLP